MNKHYTFFHNPKCSKSKAALNLLKDAGITPIIKLYLEEELNLSEIEIILKALGKEPLKSGCIRINEDIFESIRDLADGFTISQWAKIITENPILLERPILFDGERAVIGRPPENILLLIGH